MIPKTIIPIKGNNVINKSLISPPLKRKTTELQKISLFSMVSILNLSIHLDNFS
jgi:hypothetical protein